MTRSLPWICWLLLSTVACRADTQMTPEELEQWFHDDSEQRAAEVSEGELRFLPDTRTRRDDRPLPHSDNRLTIDTHSIDQGWVKLEQCHRGMDAVPLAEVVYRYRQMRGLRLVATQNIGQARVEGDSVQLEDVARDAVLCVAAEVRVFYQNPDGSFSLVNGPYHRRFLDGFFPYHVTLDIRYPADALTLLWHRPATRPGLEATSTPGALRLDAWFEGMLNTEVRFSLR